MYEQPESTAETIETESSRCPKCGRFFTRELNDAWGVENKETKCGPCARPWARILARGK